jgi:hypothetical protein
MKGTEARRKCNRALLAAVALAVAIAWSGAPAYATTWYFSDCAVGGAGTQANPFCLDPGGTGNPTSFAYLMDGAAPDVAAGDTINLCAGACDGSGTGTYHLGVTGTTTMNSLTYVFAPVVSGTQTSPITIQAFPGETVILSGDTNGDGIPQLNEPDVLITDVTNAGQNRAWYVWKNLIFEKSRTHFFYLNANPANWTFDNIEARYLGANMWNGGNLSDIGCGNDQLANYVFKVADLAGNLTIRNSRIHHICGAAHRHTVNQSTSAFILAENNEYYNVESVTNNFQGRNETWRGNYVHDFFDGITIEDDMKSIVIEDNILACYGDYKIYSDGRCGRAIHVSDGDNGPASAGKTKDVIIRRNRVYGKVIGQYGGTAVGYFMCAIRMTATNNTEPINVTIENNMVWHHQTWESDPICDGGIGVNTNRNEVTVQNNTVYDAVYGIAADAVIAGISYTIRNNLLIRANQNGKNTVEMWIGPNASGSVLRNNNLNSDGMGDPVMTIGTTNYNCSQVAAYQSGNKCATTTFVRVSGEVRNWDLHLVPTDAVNRDAGTTGAADDIDKQPRTGIVDIGADELGSLVSAVLAITTSAQQAAPSSGGNFLLKAGTYNLTLSSSVSIVSPPGALVFTDSAGAQVPVVLAGVVPGNTFTGTMSVGTSVAEGSGSFSLAAGALNDGLGDTGNAITSGRTVIVDRTPPAAPTGLRTQ